MQEQSAGHLGVVHQQDLAGVQLGRGHRLGHHDVAGLHPRGHRAAGDHVRGAAEREREERGQDEPGQHGEREDDGHACRRERRGHGTFRASQVKEAVDRLLWAALSSSTQYPMRKVSDVLGAIEVAGAVATGRPWA